MASAAVKEAAVTPPEVATFTGLPALLPSIWNWTVPVGVPAPGAAAPIVAVKITLVAHTEGFGVDTTLAIVLALLTVCVADAVLGWKLLSPL